MAEICLERRDVGMSKVILVCAMVFTFSLSGFSVAMGQAEQFLVGYWPFDEGAGEETRDASGNGHDGKLINDPAWVQGKFDRALDFGGTGSYVSVPDDDELDLSDAVTLMAWFNLNEAIAGNRRMMSKNDSIFVIFDFGNPSALDFLTKPNNDFAESTTVDWEPGEWYHFAGTYDGDTLRIYVNGELEGETSGVPPIATSSLDLWIGFDDWASALGFHGIIDDVRIYSKALTQDEIKKAMEGPVAVQMTQDKLPVTWGAIKATR
jgi:hypothetical protein